MQVMHCTADLLMSLSIDQRKISKDGEGSISLYIYIYICMVQANFPDCIRFTNAK